MCVCVRQSSLAAKLYDVKCNQIEHRATMDWEGDNTKIRFKPIPPNLVNINNHQVEAGPIQSMSPKVDWPKSGPRPDIGSADFDSHTTTE